MAFSILARGRLYFHVLVYNVCETEMGTMPKRSVKIFVVLKSMTVYFVLENDDRAD